MLDNLFMLGLLDGLSGAQPTRHFQRDTTTFFTLGNAKIGHGYKNVV